MTYFWILARLLLHKLTAPVKRLATIAAYRKNNRTCHISADANLSQVVLGKYAAVFGNATLMHTTVGDYSYVQTGSRIFNCEIGKFCSIAPGVTVAPGIHNPRYVTTHPAFSHRSAPLPKVYARNDYFANTRFVGIGNDVWIGERAILLDGIKIGDGAVVAAGAVVTKDVEPYSIVGGVPAKHLRFRHEAPIRDRIHESRWWERPEAWLEQYAELMPDPQQFTEKCCSNE